MTLDMYWSRICAAVRVHTRIGHAQVPVARQHGNMTAQRKHAVHGSPAKRTKVL